MRPVFPVNDVENSNELNEIQEHLIRLIGYDSNVHDKTVERPGLYHSIINLINSTGVEAVDKRMYSEGEKPMYAIAYRANLIYNIRRKTNG